MRILRASKGLRVVCGLLVVGVHDEAPSFVSKEPVFAHLWPVDLGINFIRMEIEVGFP